jgi:hypothetical protein
MAPFTLSQTLTFATHSRALQMATDRTKQKLRAQGLKVSQFTQAQLRTQAEAYLQDHRDELIPAAKEDALRWCAEGMLGKRVQKATLALLERGPEVGPRRHQMT